MSKAQHQYYWWFQNAHDSDYTTVLKMDVHPYVKELEEEVKRLKNFCVELQKRDSENVLILKHVCENYELDEVLKQMIKDCYGGEQ